MDQRCSKCKQNGKLKKQIQEKSNKLSELQDKLSVQERETSKVTKERNELLEYVELLEQQIDKQSAEIETLKKNQPSGGKGAQATGSGGGAAQKKYFEQVLEVVEEDGEDDDEDY